MFSSMLSPRYLGVSLICHSMLNQHIRADTRNQLLLRAKMTDEDIKLILEAQNLEEEPKEYVKMFRDKITRELLDK